MAKWVADNPHVPRSRLVAVDPPDVPGRRAGARDGPAAGQAVDLRRIDQNVLVITAGADHIAPRPGTMPFFDLIASEDVEHFERPGGHIGLVAGSAARNEIWPGIAGWLAQRSDRKRHQRGEGLMSTETDTERPHRRTSGSDHRGVPGRISPARMTGRVVFVTGGTRGIGAAISRSFAEQGAVVAAGYGRDKENAEQLLSSSRRTTSPRASIRATSARPTIAGGR